MPGANERVGAELHDVLDGEGPSTLSRLTELTREAEAADSIAECAATLMTAALEARALARRFARLNRRCRDQLIAEPFGL